MNVVSVIGIIIAREVFPAHDLEMDSEVQKKRIRYGTDQTYPFLPVTWIVDLFCYDEVEYLRVLI